MSRQIQGSSAASRDYGRVADAIRYIVDCRPDQPPLDDVAEHVGLSAFHLQRTFKRWAGVSPKQFMGFLTIEHAKAIMRSSASVLETAYEVGLSGPSRLHDLFVAFEAMTPGEYKAAGRTLEIRHGVAATPFGPALVLTTSRGVCGVDFFDDGATAALTRARAKWPLSRFVEDTVSAATVARHMFDGESRRPVQLLLRGTNFQVQVWAALLRIPEGAIVSYGDIARSVGRPTAGRAVGAAVGQNPVAFVVPCHRVLRETARSINYRWGQERRHAILAWEAARSVSKDAHPERT